MCLNRKSTGNVIAMKKPSKFFQTVCRAASSGIFPPAIFLLRLFPLFLCSIDIFAAISRWKFHLDSGRGLRENSTKFDQIRPKIF